MKNLVPCDGLILRHRGKISNNETVIDTQSQSFQTGEREVPRNSQLFLQSIFQLQIELYLS